jgi:hypothetical protein
MAVRWRRPRAPTTPPPHPGPMDHSDHRAESFSTAPGQCFAVTTTAPSVPSRRDRIARSFLGSREQRDEAAGFLADLNATASGGTAALGRCRIRFLPVSHPSGTLGSNARPSRKHCGIDLLSWIPCLRTRVISEVVTRRAPRATLPIRATSRVSAELRRNRPEPAPEDPQAGRQSPGATVQHRLHPALRYIEQRLNVHQAGVKCSPSTPMWRP